MSAALWRYLERPDPWEGSERPKAEVPVLLDEPTQPLDPKEDEPMPTDYIPKALRRYSVSVSNSITSSSPLVPGSQ